MAPCPFLFPGLGQVPLMFLWTQADCARSALPRKSSDESSPHGHRELGVAGAALSLLYFLVPSMTPGARHTAVPVSMCRSVSPVLLFTSRGQRTSHLWASVFWPLNWNPPDPSTGCCKDPKRMQVKLHVILTVSIAPIPS